MTHTPQDGQNFHSSLAPRSESFFTALAVKFERSIRICRSWSGYVRQKTRSTECLPISTRMWSQSCMYACPSLVLMGTARPPSHFNGTSIAWSLGHLCTRSKKPFMVWTLPVAITSCPHCFVSSPAGNQPLATWWRSSPDPTTESDHDPLSTIGSQILLRQAFPCSRPRLC